MEEYNECKALGQMLHSVTAKRITRAKDFEPRQESSSLPDLTKTTRHSMDSDGGFSKIQINTSSAG
jgi:hypothetical protein